MKMQNLKRLCAVVLTVLMIVSIVPTSVFAADHVHDYEQNATLREATCTETGVVKFICDCGETSYRSIAMKAHDFKEEERVDADCVNPAKIKKACKTCDHVEEADVSGSKPLGHKYVYNTETPEGSEREWEAPTCGKDGYGIRYCETCGLGKDAEPAVIPATGEHDWDDETTVDADCTEPEKVTRTCKECEKVEVISVVEGSAAKGHTYDYSCDKPEDDESKTEWKAATCDKEGFGLKVCTVCDWKAEKPEVIPATGDHDLLIEPIGETCTEPAYVVEKCANCDYVAKEVVTDNEGNVSKPLGHDLKETYPKTEDDKYKEANCTEAGLALMVCSREGCEYTEDKVIDALGHKWGDEYHIDAGCENAAGHAVMCEVCKEVVVTPYPAGSGLDEAATGHKWGAEETEPATCTAKGKVTHTCELCGETETVRELDIDPANHTGENSTILKHGDCVNGTSGVEKVEYTCCNAKTIYRTIKAENAHDWVNDDESDKNVSANCGKAGKQAQKCEKCGDTQVIDVPATGDHNYIEDEIPATCTEPAKWGKVCSVCGDEKDVQVLEGEDAAPLGHDWEYEYPETEDNKYKAATCTEAGLAVKSCSRCDIAEVDEVMPALGHKLDAEKHVDANCEHPAGFEQFCEVCKKNIFTAYPENSEVYEAQKAHEWNDEVTVAATCTKEGKITRTCKNCKLEETVSVLPIDPNNHNEVNTVLKEATCTASGIAKVTCKDCDVKPIYRSIPASHTWENVAESADNVAPTCGKAGKQAQKCASCDATQVIDVPAEGEHKYETDTIVSPTCTEPAKVGEVCTVCGDEKDVQVLGDGEDNAPLGHDWKYDYPETEDNKYKAATCTEAGLAVKSCARCYIAEVDEVMPALGHDMVDSDPLETREATCTTPAGVVKVCKNGCGYIEIVGYPEGDENYAPALGHTEEVKVVKATCQNGGYTVTVCTVCNAELTERTDITDKDANNHDYSTVKWLKEATCSAAGVAKKTCACGDSIYVSEKLEHDMDKSDIVSEDGTYIYIKCKNCDYTEFVGAVDADTFECPEELGHIEVVDEAVDATCTEAGLTEGSHCSRCNAVIKAQETVEALGHKEEIIPAVAATCTVEGLTEGKKCSVCGEELLAQEETEMLAHTEEVVAGKAATCTATGLTEGKKCSVCGEELLAQEEIEMLAHTEEVVAGKAATCTETGLTDGVKCSVCGVELLAQEEIAKLEHKAVEVESKDATCTEAGVKGGTVCEVCDEILTADEVIEALGHTEAIIEAVAPTCTTAGSTEGKICSVCEAILVEVEAVEALGHKEEIIPAVAATCTVEGLTEGKKCAECGEILVAQTIIEKLAHTEETVTGYAATCTASGLTDGKKCSVCGEITVAQEEIPAGEHNYVYVSSYVHPAYGYTMYKFECTECGKGNYQDHR